MSPRLLGIDLGGTHTKLLLAEPSGAGDAAVPVGWHALRTDTVPTPTDLTRLVERVVAFVGADRPDGFALTVPGVLDPDRGAVRRSTNLPWLEGHDPTAGIAAALDCPGIAVHDGAAAARAEAVVGAGRGRPDVFVLVLGTGIAGVHVLDGVVRRGAHGAAGEIGHVRAGGRRRCSCGQRGCLETLLGGAQLGARWDEGRGTGAGSTARAVLDAARRRDPVAVTVLEEATSALARCLLGVVALLDPGLIVLGGGLAVADLVVEPAVAQARREATFHRLPPVVLAALGVNAGAWGAVLAAHGVVDPSWAGGVAPVTTSVDAQR